MRPRLRPPRPHTDSGQYGHNQYDGDDDPHMPAVPCCCGCVRSSGARHRRIVDRLACCRSCRPGRHPPSRRLCRRQRRWQRRTVHVRHQRTLLRFLHADRLHHRGRRRLERHRLNPVFRMGGLRFLHGLSTHRAYRIIRIGRATAMWALHGAFFLLYHRRSARRNSRRIRLHCTGEGAGMGLQCLSSDWLRPTGAGHESMGRITQRQPSRRSWRRSPGAGPRLPGTHRGSESSRR